MTGALTRIIEIEGERKLALDTGLDMRQFARAGVSRIAAEDGTVHTAEGSRAPWRMEGTAEIDGRVFAYGPLFLGMPYPELAAVQPETALNVLRRLSREETEPPVSELVPGAALAAEDGTVLELPKGIALRALEASGARAVLDGFRRWAHPDLLGEEARTFTLAALAYDLICGTAPFPAENAEEAAADMRDRKVLPSGLACPGLNPALATTLDGILGKEPRPSLKDLAAALGEPGSGGTAAFVSPLAAAERQRLDQERQRHEAKTTKTVAQHRFWRRHGKLVLGIAAAVVVAALGAWNLIAARADRFTTEGLSAGEVAETYYYAFDDIDPDRLEACLAKGAPKTDVEAVTNLFVIFRVRQAYESKIPYIRAEEWLASGSPETEKAVFGITDLKIEPEGLNEYLATYRLYAPGTKGEHREDRLVLVDSEGLWKIAKLDRRILPD